MASVIGFPGPHFFVLNSENKLRTRVLQVKSLGGKDSPGLSSESVVLNGASGIEEREERRSVIDRGNGSLRLKVKEEKRVEDGGGLESLEPLYDDGYGTVTVKDYFHANKEMIKPDGGPPRWFSPIECGRPLKDSPILLFLPGLDGTGWGLILHHKALGKAFEVRCLHIPVNDRTPFEGLVKFVEETIRLEHASSPNKPIYLVGDSFGGCLSLAIAARNPTIDLVLTLVNPATSVERSPLQPLFPILAAMPDELHIAVPYLLGFVMGDPTKMAMVNIENRLPSSLKLTQMSRNLTDLLPYLSSLADIIPRDTLLWKLKLLKSAAAYANSRLHAVKAEVLVLASGKDNMVPSREEAERLARSLQNCTVRHFNDNGHTLLLEDGVNLMSVIKGTYKYRRSRKHDYVSDFLPPSMWELKYTCDEQFGLLRLSTASVMLSTLEDGKIVRGLAGVPDEGPVLLVGNHNLLGLEVYSLVEEFLREKSIMVRGVAHPALFWGKHGNLAQFDYLKIFGAVPVTAKNLFKLLATKSHVLLYPGGAREALHNKGEEYKLFWPDQPEFVRMAARFGATIVPFAAVGEDDMLELVVDYNDLMNIPVVSDYLKAAKLDSIKIRDESSGEVANIQLFFPGILPKIPGRYYCLFGKPIETKGKKEILKDKENANELYLQIQSDIENSLAYLIKKREEDPYRNVFDRTVYRAMYHHVEEVPTFEP
ncbi:phytyl ester synthase 1, chloroplastic isoform X1 [Pyrus x bretschneideri]|uniref:phytyl ester synthase 1, chloroplastic isoform X1 n=1 Tax=Pyrus x bretschneideri TaxID=225117 RepID=UPI00202F5886|nr:phytyl ester synthase 1, chloroplastic isoform X1 [Pyrus x bretschneideri]